MEDGSENSEELELGFLVPSCPAIDPQSRAPGQMTQAPPLYLICHLPGPGLDSGDCGDNGAIRHDGPVQLNLLGRCDASVGAQGVEVPQVPGETLLILKLSRWKRKSQASGPAFPVFLLSPGSFTSIGLCRLLPCGFPRPRGEVHLSSGQWSGRGRCHRQCGSAQEFSWGKGWHQKHPHDQAAPLSTHLRCSFLPHTHCAVSTAATPQYP